MLGKLSYKDFKQSKSGWYETDKNPNIRFDVIIDKNYRVMSFVFQIYKKPFFWGKIGRKRWIGLCECSCFYKGLEFSLLKLK